jgi:ABC-type glutathione transport system ATPase component
LHRTHDPGIVHDFCGRIMVMDAGRIVEIVSTAILRRISPSRFRAVHRATLRICTEKCVTSTIALKEIVDGHFSACLRIQLKEIDLSPAHLPEKALARKVDY